MNLDHNRFMERAIVLAGESMDEGNGPVGCVIVKDGQVIGEGRNLVRTSGDPSAHGEMVAIRNVAAGRGSGALSGCTLYSSMEPCPMCGWAILDTKISALVLGARHASFRTKEVGTYSVEALAAMTGRKLEIISGVREKECEDLRYAALERSVRETRQVNPAAEEDRGSSLGGWFRRSRKP
jgi:tRNA(Arg) A34 adenosine deaminase TadA